MPKATHHILPLGARASFGPLPPLAGKFSGPAIVLGRAPGWMQELDIALEVTDCEAPIFAVNHHVGHYGCLDFEHVVSVHSCTYPNRDKRRPDVVYHSQKPLITNPNADVFWPLPGVGGSGSSALLGVVVALNMGYDPVYVAGVHLTESTCDVDEEGREFLHSYTSYHDGWISMREQLLGRVFSVSPRGTFLRDLLEG